MRVNTRTLRSSVHALVLAATAASGCAESQYDYREANYDRRVEEGTVLRTIPLDPATEEEILALDPEQITEKGVREILLRASAQRILIIHGGIGGVIPVYATVPVTAHLAKDGKIRDWINEYVPTERPELTAVFESSSQNILWAADVWHSVKKYWCLEAQVLIRAKRAMLGDH